MIFHNVTYCQAGALPHGKCHRKDEMANLAYAVIVFPKTSFLLKTIHNEAVPKLQFLDKLIFKRFFHHAY
jgi:hypothetical protein